MKRHALTISKLISAFVCFIIFVVVAAAQSRDQNFPTPITSNEIVGAMKARDVGDPRLTTYYYAFEGSQGDIFINSVTNNFSGDIDIFTQEGLRPLTKMVIYADSGSNENGRLIYLRKSEKLFLRIQGRSPNDDPATFRIKFGGSFIALREGKEDGPPTIEPDADKSTLNVNSVGTIVRIQPSSETAPKTVPIKKVDQEISETTTNQKTKIEEIETLVEPIDKTVPDEIAEKKAEESRKTPPGKITIINSPKKVSTKASAIEIVKEEKADPLAKIRLLIEMKDGRVIERPMNEVLKFSVDKGVLTVTNTNGVTTKFSILDVARVTIE